jgi:hypothetical protein
MKILILAIVVLTAGVLTQAEGAPAKPVKLRVASQSSTRPDNKPKTPHLEFVTEYVRELAAIEGIRESGETELKADPQSVFMNRHSQRHAHATGTQNSDWSVERIAPS